MKNIFQKSNMKNSGVNARLDFIAMKIFTPTNTKNLPTIP